MFDTKSELLEAIRLGETSFLEFKEVRFRGLEIRGPSRDDLANELAAFANSAGGVLMLGVEDRSRAIVGIPLESVDNVVDYVKEICSDSIRPPIESYVLTRVQVPSAIADDDDVIVIKMEVPRSLFVHQSPGGYYLRAGDSKRVMTPDLLARLFQQRSQTRLIRFDEQPVAGARMGDLDPDLCSRFRTANSDENDEIFLAKLGMIAETSDGYYSPTISGILMGCETPQRWLPNAYVQAVAYRGAVLEASREGGGYQLDAVDITGPLDVQVGEAVRFVVRHMRTSASKIVGRIDEPQFDHAVVFEAMVNAVAHRDYSIHGAKIRLRLYDDRLELFSPGSLANSLTVDSLRYRQSARNETICSLLSRCRVPDVPWLSGARMHFMERRGEGVPIILDKSTAIAGREPEYRLFDDAELMLTIYAGEPGYSVRHLTDEQRAALW